MAEKDPATENKAKNGDKRTVLDQSKLLGDVFDEDILSDIERHLDGSISAPSGGSRDKVELDKADLPLIPIPAQEAPPPPPEPAEEPEPQVDMPAEEAEEDQEPVRGEPPFWRKHLIPIAAGLILALAAGGLLQWLSQPESLPPPPRVAGRLPDLDFNLRMDLEPFLVPLAKGPGGQLLRAGVVLEGYDAMDMAQIKDDLIRVRDVIYRLLRDRPADELGGDRMQDLLGTQIRTELNQSLGGQKVRRVHLTQFIISG